MLFILFLLIQIKVSLSWWEYAICTRHNVIFYDYNWTEIMASSNNFKNLRALSYDISRDVLYVSDQNVIVQFPLEKKKLTSSVLVSLDTRIQDIVYDYHDDILYVSTEKNILKMYLKNRRVEVFVNETLGPTSLELDTCKRKLYYISMTSIVSVSLDENRTIISRACKICSQSVAALDLKSGQIYLTQKVASNYYIHSFFNDNFTQHFRSYDKTPRGIAISDAIYYLDGTEHTLRKVESNISRTILQFKDDPMNIIVRNNSFICTLIPYEQDRDQNVYINTHVLFFGTWFTLLTIVNVVIFIYRAVKRVYIPLK